MGYQDKISVFLHPKLISLCYQVKAALSIKVLLSPPNIIFPCRERTEEVRNVS